MNEEGHFSEAEYPFTIKPNSSILGIIIDICRQEPLISFIPADSIRDRLGFNPGTIYEKHNPSDKPVDSLSFDKTFPETDIAERMIFKGKRSGRIHNFTMDVHPS